MITLTEQERQRFALYAAQEAESYKRLVGQMSKLNVPKEFLLRNKATGGAYLLVAEHLTNVETTTIK